MATAMVGAAFSVLGKALAPLTDGLLKDWAASVKLGPNVEALELELLSAQAMLEPTLNREVDNSALKKLLVRLQDLGYDAEDVLDELDYFRIQDELDGTFDAADNHAKGRIHNLALNAKAVGKQIICLPACLSATTGAKAKHRRREVNNGSMAKLVTSRAFCNTSHAAGKCFPCTTQPSVIRDDDNESDGDSSPNRNHTSSVEPPKLRFNRVDASKRMQHIVEQLRLVQQKVSGIIATLGSNWSTVPNIAQSRPITTSESIEPKLYGRGLMMNSIIHDITKGKHSGEVLTVIPIVGPGGIGKTTLAQHIYHSEQVQQHFDVKVWTCVSLNFNANKLIEEIGKCIPKVHGESSIGTAGELIGQRLKSKRFLLVLDDMWDCSNEDEWGRLLLPFKKSQVQGSIIIVTTRFPAQAQIMVTTIIDHSVHLQGLEHKEFKDLFLDFVFGNDKSRKDDHIFLLEIGYKIVARLKGSPLAAKTVGRLLKQQLDLVHWTRVLESKEWEKSNNDNDVMPALKLSYDYLPSQLQQCFSHCALFPQDYKFEREELINFWIGLGVLHSSCGENKRVEDIGLSHLKQLINYGFFEERKEFGRTFYILHDLLHELALKVSSHECLTIDSSKVKSLAISPSVRHLSINIDDASVEDRFSVKNCMEDLNTLGKRLKIEKLRSLMLFGEHGCFVKAFGDLFREAKALRIVLLSGASYDVEDLLYNFYSLVHLRYLRIDGARVPARFPNKISRFYHVIVLEARYYYDPIDLPRDMSNLLKLRHFLVANDTTHSSIVEVGKLKSLQELRRFVVKQEGQGFELRQIGHLQGLRGTLCITNLETIQAKEEADEAKLLQKNHLHELIFCWNIDRCTNDSALEEHVLERLKPSSNLSKLSIIGHGGATCPSWLGTNLSMKSLESLCLDGVAWKTFPPIGELWLVNVPRQETSGYVLDKRFENLRKLQLVNLPRLKRWVVHAPCQLFPFLEVLVIRGCSRLVELSFSHSACCQQEKEALSFPRLSELKIGNCPQLLSLPPVPWTEDPCSIEIEGTGSPWIHKLVCGEDCLTSEYGMTFTGKDTPHSTSSFAVLAFRNLTKLKEFSMDRCQTLPLRHLQMLSSLTVLRMFRCGIACPFSEGDGHVDYQFPVKSIYIYDCRASGKELTQLLTFFPKLTNLKLLHCENITGLAVNVMRQQATPGQSSSANEVDAAIEQQKDARAEEGIVALAAEEGLLLLPPQLEEMLIHHCPDLSLLSNPLNHNKEDGRTCRRGGAALQGLRCLRQLCIKNCPRLLSSYSSSSSLSSCFPFPNSLEHLELEGAVGIDVVSLSYLSSLTSLSINECGDLRGEGLLSLLAQGHLTKLHVTRTPNFFVDSDPSRAHEQVLPSHSSKLQHLTIDDVARFAAMPISSLLFPSLTTLKLERDHEVELFTKEQEARLFVNSLEEITIRFCRRLQYLPARLYSLPCLKRLNIWESEIIRLLPKDGLPSTLQELDIYGCTAIRLPKDCLPSSLQKLVITDCPAIRSLPKVDDLPTSLRELEVYESESEELRKQCRKLIGIIPIVRA